MTMIQQIQGSYLLFDKHPIKRNQLQDFETKRAESSNNEDKPLDRLLISSMQVFSRDSELLLFTHDGMYGFVGKDQHL